LKGKELIKEELLSKDQQIDVRSLPSGVYVIKVTGVQNQIFRFIKQ